VPGKPQQQGSKTAYVVKGRAVLTEANKNLMPWRKDAMPLVLAAAKEQGWEKPAPEAALSVTMDFYFEKPKSVKRTSMTVAPDCDKLARSVLDLLSHPGAGVIPDDSQVVEIVARKHYGEPRTEITLKVLEN